MKHNLLKSVILSVILFMGVTNAWGNWYLPGTIHEPRWNHKDNDMGNEKTITFYAVPAGTYQFQLTNGNNEWSGNGCIKEHSDEVTIGKNGNNATITTTETRDITIEVIDEVNWKVSVTTSAPTYHLKARWDGNEGAENWSWQKFYDNGDGTHSLKHAYKNTISAHGYNYIKISSNDPNTYKHTANNVTLVNSLAENDECIYTFNPSNGALEIRKCNTVTQPFHIYFDNSKAGWSSEREHIKFIIGHASYSRAYPLYEISNTKLFYRHINFDTNWNWPDAGYYAMISNPGEWAEGYWGRKAIKDAKNYSAAYLQPFNMVAKHSYLLETTNDNNGTPITITDKGENGLPNTTQTVQYALSTYIDDQNRGVHEIMTSGNTPGKISISSYKFTDGVYDRVTLESALLNASANEYSISFTAAQTATTTLIVDEIVNGYKFDGWYTEDGTLLSPKSTYTYYPTTSQTIHARFREGAEIMLDPFPYAEYGVNINGEEFLCLSSDVRTIEVPMGTTVEIINKKPTHYFWDYNPKYDYSVVAQPKGENIQEINNSAYTIRKDVNFCPNYGIKNNYRVYLHIPNTQIPNNNVTFLEKWNSINSNFKNFIYAKDYLSNGQLEVNGIKKGQLIYMTKDDYLSNLGKGEYWYVDVPAGYHTFRFERKEDRIGVGTDFGARSEEFGNFVMPFKDGNCYTLNNFDGSVTFTGTWGAVGLPQCTVTLGFTDIGKYGVKNLNTGEVYYAQPGTSENDNIVFTVPYGTPLEILEGELGEGYKNTYTGTVGMKAATSSIEKRFEFNTNDPNDNIVTITRNTMFDDLFGFKKGVVIYLAVPKEEVPNVFKNWTTCDSHPTHEVYMYIDKPYVGRSLVAKTGVIETSSTIYYKFDGNDLEGTYKFEFQRKEGNNTNAPHAQTIEFKYPQISPTNCFIMDGTKPSNKDGGYWGYVEITVTLDPFPYGSYGVKYDGKTYMSDPVNEVYIHNVPFGAQVQVIDAVSNTTEYSHKLNNNGEKMYTCDVVVKPSPTAVINSIESSNDYMHTISDITRFSPNMVTTKPHIVYLHIPEDVIAAWNKNENYTTYVWATEYLTNGGQGRPGALVEMTKIAISGNGYGDYYQCEIPAGYNKFYFERKPQQDGGNVSKTVDLIYEIPLNESLNCYSLYPDQNTGPYKGTWVEAPARVGDYRLLYAEKELIKTHEEGEQEDWEVVFRTVYSHPSNIIRKVAQDEASSNTVSLHINTSQMRNSKKVHPMVILQRYQTVNSKEQWVDIEAHTVLPLKAEGNMAMLPGRKKTYGEFPFYSNGIDNITNDTTYEYRGHAGSGVWNFVVSQGSDGSVELVLPQTERYQGTYYIRTEAINSWNDYNNIACDMTRSTYAEKYSGFSHYYCDWLLKDKDVKFVVANEFDHAISDPFTADAYTDNGVLTENANVRFSWENMTNNVSRAYIQGTWSTDREPPLRLDNIELNYKPADDEANKETLLYDSGNWIYAINLDKVKVGSVLNSLTAEYPVESGNIQTFANDLQMLVGDNNNKSNYIVRVLYDFKINKTLVALVPNENNANIAIDVLIERIDQNEATQVVSPIESSKRNIVDGNETPGSTVYGVFTFTKKHLTNELLSDQERLTYWFSLPFDVLLSDIFGFGEVGKSWMIKYYDGKDRAETGLTDNNTFWKYITKRSTVLEANKGYVLSLNKQLMNKNNAIYTNSDTISLYFPSQGVVTNIDDGYTVAQETPINIPEWTGPTAKKEWNWNLIGMPSYANKTQEIKQDHLYYFFDYNHETDSYTPCWIGEKEFKSMFAYMVQFGGTINWYTFDTEPTTPREIAAQRTSEEKKHVLRIDLMHNAQREDKTYVQLMDEKATANFDMNLDLTKMVNANANIYSLAGNHQLAANVLPMEATTVPLGVIIKTAGEYTFSMPDGTDGITAELIDYQTNTRTNLLLDNYTVTLPAGTNNSRFALSLQPDKTVTSVDNIGNEATGDKVKKYLIDGKLYLQKDGVLYDAQGHSL